ncbi:hypothetical protein ELQ35_18275 [Peribacillus cavernae]|uniref:Uncharacterized protein n=1 Tax=Peribacillus cavernae TaxID=1674310 RepID=A0A3S0V8G3_9BACI|nr:hypothetical protein [Peribacillus cavernae]MDQ0219864.1 FAD synthase [Peribacillus cavernae]RUQ26646.1 hypothetical protein ELQ35_18275 [Peribacillus cavernae]
MKVCYLSYPLDLSECYIPSAVSMDYFDGVHLAHQRVIQTGIQIAASKKVVRNVTNNSEGAFEEWRVYVRRSTNRSEKPASRSIA